MVDSLLPMRNSKPLYMGLNTPVLYLAPPISEQDIPLSKQTTASSLYISSLLIMYAGYSQFRRELSDGARQSGDRVLGSLDLLLPRSGGWPHSHAHSCGEDTQRILESARAAVPVATPAGYLENYLLFLKSKQMF